MDEQMEDFRVFKMLEKYQGLKSTEYFSFFHQIILE